MSVLDIGANVGAWTKVMQSAWPFASFMLIEANPGCRAALEMAGHPFAITLLGKEQKRNVPFYRLDNTATGASVYRELTGLYDDVEPILLDQTTLDDLFPGRVFDLIKIDTQGSELDILSGGLGLVSKACHVLLEVSHKPYNEGAPLAGEVFRFMEALGFTKAVQVDWVDSIEQGDYLFSR